MQHEIIMKKLNEISTKQDRLSSKLNTLLFTEYSVQDVAAELNLSDSYVYKLPKEVLDYKKRGKFRIYLKEDVLRFKKELEQNPSLNLHAI